MENKEIREPIQKRSIQKKESIISKGFELICQKGYYNTNTAEIAKAAGVSTGILIFTKTGHGGTDNVWFYDMTADGFSLDDKRSPIAENDIPDIIERFKNRDKEADRQRTDKSFFVPVSEIKSNDYDLSINKYKKTEYVPVEYPSTGEIMVNLRELEMEIGSAMDELEKLLGMN